MLRWLFAVLALMASASVVRADSRGTTVEWHGLRALGLSPEELRAADDVLARALVGRWFSAVDRVEGAEQKCGNQVPCHCNIARNRGERYAAFGTAGRIANSWSVELSLIDTHACTVIASAVLAENVAAPAVADRLRDLGSQIGTPPDTVATTAVKSARSLDKTPAIVSTITGAQLRASQMTTLEDAFASQPGFDVIDTNWGSLPLTQGIRNTVLLVVDGVPQINNLLHLRALGRDARISVRNVERIDFVRGPGSVIWGPNAFLGVVHVVTRDAKSRDGQVDAGIELGTADSQQAWVNGAQSRGDYGVAISIDAGSRRGLKSVVKNSPWAARGRPFPELPWGNAGVTDPLPDRWLDLGLKLDLGRHVTAMFKNQTSYTTHEISLYGPKLPAGEEGFYDKTWRTYAVTANREVADGLTLSAIVSRFEFYSWENFAINRSYPDALDTDPDNIKLGSRSLQGNAEKPRATHQGELRLSQFSGYPEDGWKNQLLVGLLALDMGSPENFATQLPPNQEPTKPYLDYVASNRRSVSLFGINEWSPYPWIVLAGGARLRVEAPLQKHDHPDAPPPPANEPPAEWKQGISFQGAALLAGESSGGKLVYSEGYRVPDGNSLLSTSGVYGDPTLSAERSRELAVQVHAEVAPGFTASLGGNLTRLTELINYEIYVDDPNTTDDDKFSRVPGNSGKTDIASGYAELRWESEIVDAIGRYGVTGLRESDPAKLYGHTPAMPRISHGIPISPHNLFGTIVVRPAQDISVFARSTAVSPRRVEMMIPGGSRYTKLPWAVRLALGGTFSNVISRFDLDLRIENPFNFKRRMPYDPSGVETFVEDRTGSEVFATLRYTH